MKNSATKACPDEDRLFAVYVHWPFCASKCPYCDFNSHVREHIDHSRWRDALLAELDYYADQTPGRTVSSLFFGGGTPSLMEPETVAAVIDRVSGRWQVADDIEITLEANPTSSERGKFEAFRSAGVNRLSIGVQSFDDEALKALGRKHNAKDAAQALEFARETFDRFSFDLIYARPHQSLKEWQQEIEMAMYFSSGHVSVYQLTIEPGTEFYTQAQRGALKVPEEELAADFYELTQEVLSGAGLPAYEVSNHARAGQESRHNLVYWRYGDYAGIGPGAHGRLTLEGQKLAVRAHRAPEIWFDLVGRNGHGAHPFEVVEPRERAEESLMMGLRLAEGVPLSRIEEELGAPWTEAISQDRLAALQAEGMLKFDGERLLPTQQGLQRLNAMLAYLLS